MDGNPWSAPDAFPLAPTESPYGVKAGRKLVPYATLAEVEKRCSRDEIPPISLVWTPASDGLVPAAQVNELLPVLRARARSRAIRGLVIGLFYVAVGGWAAWPFVGEDLKGTKSFFLLLFISLGVLPTIANARLLWMLKRRPSA